MRKIRILLIGPVPPPSGGVSIHVRRLAKKINESPDFECAVFDIGKMKFYNSISAQKNLIEALIYFFNCSIVHIHIAHKYKVIVAGIAKLFGKKIVFTQHNLREEKNQSSIKMYNLSSKIIVVNPNSRADKNEKVLIIPAYIPADQKEDIGNNLKNDLTKYKKVVVAIASHPPEKPVLQNGKDIYGFDVILNAYERFAQAGMLLLLIDVNGAMSSFYEKQVRMLIAENLAVKYVSSEVAFSSLLKYIDVFIRPTRSDGDSIAIREALACGVKVLASDCVTRPSGVALFKNGDELSLSEELLDLLKKSKPTPLAQSDNSRQILVLYRLL